MVDPIVLEILSNLADKGIRLSALVLEILTLEVTVIKLKNLSLLVGFDGKVSKFLLVCSLNSDAIPLSIGTQLY